MGIYTKQKENISRGLKGELQMLYVLGFIFIVLLVGRLYCAISDLNIVRGSLKKEESDGVSEVMEEDEEYENISCVECGSSARIETCWDCWEKLCREKDELEKSFDSQKPKKPDLIDHIEVISEPGGTFKVERIHLTPEGKEMLTSHKNIELPTQK
jgi:hypothetical protein